MSETFRSKAEKANDMLKDLRNIEATLEYWEPRTTDNRAKLIGLSKQALKMVADDIYNEELSGIARLRD